MPDDVDIVGIEMGCASCITEEPDGDKCPCWELGEYVSSACFWMKVGEVEFTCVGGSDE